jgi:hypothetical protein
MTGEDSLSLAARLSAGSSEADRRSSVSRAYYGAFHVCYELIARCGISLPKSAAAHDKLFHCLANSGDQELFDAANTLSSLRNKRNLADYNLSVAEFRDANNIRSNLDRAAEVLSLIRNCDLAAIRA